MKTKSEVEIEVLEKEIEELKEQVAEKEQKEVQKAVSKMSVPKLRMLVAFLMGMLAEHYSEKVLLEEFEQDMKEREVEE